MMDGRTLAEKNERNLLRMVLCDNDGIQLLFLLANVSCLITCYDLFHQIKFTE